MSDKLGVALIKYVCPICGKINEDATEIAMNNRLTEAAAKQVEKLHNQVVGFSKKPCKDCQGWIDKGAFMVIGIDKDKTTDMSNPYRSGHLVGIKKDSEWFKGLPDKYKKKAALFMDYHDMAAQGMIQLEEE